MGAIWGDGISVTGCPARCLAFPAKGQPLDAHSSSACGLLAAWRYLLQPRYLPQIGLPNESMVTNPEADRVGQMQHPGQPDHASQLVDPSQE